MTSDPVKLIINMNITPAYAVSPRNSPHITPNSSLCSFGPHLVKPSACGHVIGSTVTCLSEPSRCQGELWKAQAGLNCLPWQRKRRCWFLLAAGQSSEQREQGEQGSPAAALREVWELITLRSEEQNAEWCAKKPTLHKTHTLLSSLGSSRKNRALL